MLKILLLAVAIWLVLTILKQYRKNIDLSGKQSNDATASARKPKGEIMVQCHQCGTHLPKSESLTANGQHYCCEAHRTSDSDPS